MSIGVLGPLTVDGDDAGLSPRDRVVLAALIVARGQVVSADPSVWLAEACAIAGRDLTQDEWNRYLPDRPYRRTWAGV